MKKISSLIQCSFLSALFLLGTGRSDAVWITNFSSVTSGPGGSASGFWRDVAVSNTGVGVDSSFVVSLSTTGEVKSTTHLTQPSRIDESFPWRNLAAGESVILPGDTTPTLLPFAVPLPFSVGANGDFINVQTEGGASSVVTLSLGAQITNPMLSFSDIDVNTTLMFTSAFSVASGTSNLESGVAMQVSNDGTTAPPPFDEEAAGSLQFTGTFTQLQFTIINTGPSQDGDDRTGFVVSSLSEPVTIPEPGSCLFLTFAAGVLVLRRRK